MTDAITIRGAAPAPADAAKAAIERRKKVDAIRGFEEMFLTEMMKSMRKTVPEGEEGGNAKGIWKERFDAEIAHRIAESGGIGLSKMLERGLAVPSGRK